MMGIPIESAMDGDGLTIRQKPPFRYLDGIGEWDDAMNEMTGWVYLQHSDQRMYARQAASVLLVEAIAQLSGVLLRKKMGGDGNGGVLASIDEAHFNPKALTRSGVFLRTRIKRDVFPYCVLEGTAKQDGYLVAACTISVRSLDAEEARR